MFLNLFFISLVFISLILLILSFFMLIFICLVIFFLVIYFLIFFFPFMFFNLFLILPHEVIYLTRNVIFPAEIILIHSQIARPNLRLSAKALCRWNFFLAQINFLSPRCYLAGENVGLSKNQRKIGCWPYVDQLKWETKISGVTAKVWS